MFTTFGAIVLGTGLWLWILRSYDRIEPEALRYLFVVAILGGAASVSVAALLNEGLSDLIGVQSDVFEDSSSISVGKLLLFSIFVGFNEEICKATATIFTVKRFGNFNEPVDAMIYAMSVGLGFAAIENVLYATRFGNEVLLVRFLWPVPAHMAYAALWGYGFAKARFIRTDESIIRVMGPSVLVAGAIHAGANFLLFLQEIPAAVLSLAALGGLAYLAHLRLRRLTAESPFLEPGECPNCRNLNRPNATECVYCGEPLVKTEMFVTCPCGSARIPIDVRKCPACGCRLEEETLQQSDQVH